MTLHRSVYTQLATGLLTVAAVISGSPATAQTEQQVDKPAAKEPGALAEVLVTAQRRVESLQEVPIVINAFSAEQLSKAGVTSTEDLTRLTPGLNITNALGNGAVFLRGVGTANTTTSESNVAFYLDDVYIADASSDLMNLENVERVEVLKGPQGTLYGRNATAGLIHIITPDPQAQFNVKAKVSYESYQAVIGSVYVTGGLTDTLKASLQYDGRDQREGMGTNLALNQEINFIKYWNLRSKLLWEPTGSDRFTVSLGHYENTSDLGQYAAEAPGEYTILGATYTGSPFKVNASVRAHPYVANEDVSLKWEHKFDNGVTFKSVSAYRDATWLFNSYDPDGSAINFILADQPRQFHSIQQEFVLQGTPTVLGRPLDITGGAFYFHSKSNYGLFVKIIPLQVEQDQNSDFRNQSYAAFSQGDYHLTDADTLTLGTRFTYDKLRLDASAATNGFQTAVLNDAQDHFDNISWRVAYKHDFSRDLMGYASVSRGYKSGLFNSGQVSEGSPEVVKPESLTDYEFGFKSTLLDGKMQFNASAFYYDYKDLQVLGIVGQVVFLRNAAAARIFGGELENVLAVPVPAGDLQLRATVSYLDTRYQTFQGCNVNVPNAFPPGGSTSTVGDCSGHQLIFSPKYQGTAGATYSVPVGKRGAKFGLSALYYHASGYYYDPDNRVQLKDRDEVNAELFYSFLDERARVRLYGSNLTNQQAFNYCNQNTLQSGCTPRPPRVIGGGFQYTLR